MVGRSEIQIEAGPRQFASLRDALEQGGVIVQGDEPTELRHGKYEEIVWIFVAIGLDRAVDVAIAQVRERWPGIKIRVKRRTEDSD